MLECHEIFGEVRRLLAKQSYLPKVKKIWKHIPIQLYYQLPSCSEVFSAHVISWSFSLMISHVTGLRLFFEYLQIPQFMVMELQNYLDRKVPSSPPFYSIYGPH